MECEFCGWTEGDPSGEYAVACGCGKHGDHLGCDYSCKDYDDCAQPLGTEITCTH